MTGQRPSAVHINYEPIGVIRSQHTVPEQTPIQPVYARGCPAGPRCCPSMWKD
jgi:hypothetical protein